MEHDNMSVQAKDDIHTFHQLEDKVLKTAAMFFGHDLLPYLGVKGRMTAIAPTEQVHLDVRRMEEDFNFRMDDGTIRHLEFESDRITEKDLRRFREYEAYLSMISECPVITTVLCSAKMKDSRTTLKCGINLYQIELIRIKTQDAGAVFNRLKKKLEDGQCITRSDLFPVLLTPLMSGTMKMCKRICLGMDYLHSEQVTADKDEIRHMEAALYTLAIKFLNRTDLEKVKEKMRMTLLGQMLMEDGIEKGEMTKLISQVMKKMKKEMSPADIAEVLEEEQMVINRIYSAVTDHPDENEDAIYELLYQQRS